MEQNPPHLILPTGTQVVALTEVRSGDGKVVHPRGAVGVVLQSPSDYWHSYRIRFPQGFEASFARQELAVLSQYQNGGVIDAAADGSAALLAEYGLQRFVIYRCVVGSKAYGLDDESSDFDRRGIYLPPAELHWALYGVPQQFDDR